MKRVLILAVGRKGEREISEACDEYHRRCRSALRVEQQVVRDLKDLLRALPKRSMVVALDQRGEQLTSEQFAAQLRRWVEECGGEIAFLVGGAEGLGDELCRRAHRVLSLGQMTFAHQVARLILAEQIYRAVSIWEGAPYHR